ncbi:Major Facilitator [Gracilaria domingensis]|nr:Major Facilitator [Gracilaria domingensis]
MKSILPFHASRAVQKQRTGILFTTMRDSRADVNSEDNVDEHRTHPSTFSMSNVPERFRVVILCFISFIICNCDRINISVAILPMAKFYGWSQTTVGIIQSAFFWGYVLTQIPGGYLADKYGGKHVLAAGVIVWSAMTLVTPIAASSNLGLLLLARALLGVGEGVAMPAMNNIISKWVPEKERARSLSLTYSGMYLGSVIGLWLCPQFIVSFGWQSVFYIFGAFGFVWWFAWQGLTTSTPQLSSTISSEELQYIESGAPGVEKEVSDVPWRRLFSKKATWAIIVAHFCATWVCQITNRIALIMLGTGYFVLLIWLPTYFNRQLGFDLAASSFLSILPWLAMFLSANVGGLIADAMRSRGMSLTAVRKTMQSIGFLGPAFFLALVATTNTPSLAVFYMTSALALGSFSQSGALGEFTFEFWKRQSLISRGDASG